MGGTQFVLLRSKGMLMRAWFGKVRFVSLIAWEIMRLMRPLILVDGELIFLLLMLDATLLGSAGGGIR